MNEYGIIYSATNITNGCKYIGQTTRGLQHRKSNHESKTTQKETVFKKAAQIVTYNCLYV